MEGANVILIISDTHRNDVFNGTFRIRNKIADIPYLNYFKRESVIFKRAYTSSFPTVPHRHDIMVSKFTFTYSDWAPLPKDELTLPEMLRSKGYISSLIAATPHILKDGYNYDRRFDRWIWIRGQENDRFRTAPRDLRLPCEPEKLRDVNATLQHLRNNYYKIREED